jgi:hypothetical protein
MYKPETDFVCVPIPSSVYLEVANYLREAQSSTTPSEFFCMAVDYLRDNIDMKPEDLGHLLEKPTHGYMWKQLFLPAGTLARMKYKGKWYQAEVVGNDFLYHSELMSPSQFANQVTNSNRNAWKDIFIKRPGDSGWTLADKMRSDEQKELMEIVFGAENE